MIPPSENLPPDEPYRPQFHFTSRAHWINDPNGLVYYDGEYHLFFQYHPESIQWGPMHWGHAVSRDLIHWSELPIALYPDDLGTIFSGSAVIDWRNTAGFGAEAMVALFTHHHPATERQCQSLAYSLDKGRNWIKYAGNPVIDTPADLRDFRDPKVFWYGNRDDGHWVMVVAAGDAIFFYRSGNLIDWQAVSSFGYDYGCTAGIWETPDLFELQVHGSDESRWVLLVGISDGAVAGGSGEQYFVGDFDGERFVSENPESTVLWADYGADAYATQSWSDAPDGSCIAISWMSNWAYGRVLPTSTWRGAMALPRRLSLVATPQGIRLRQQIVDQAEVLRGEARRWTDVTIHPYESFFPALAPGQLWEIEVRFALADIESGCVGIRLHYGDDVQVEFGYTIESQRLYVDRRFSGNTAFSDAFAAIHTAPLALEDDEIHLHALLDTSSLELLANHGVVSMTERIFPPPMSPIIEIFSQIAAVTASTLSITALDRAR